MLKPIALLLAVCGAGFLIACDHTPPPPMSATTVKADCPSATADDYYFGPNELHPWPDAHSNERLRDDITQFLSAAGFPSLSCGTSRDAYRFIWLPANRPTIIAAATAAGADQWELAGVRFIDPRKTDRPELQSWTARLKVEHSTSRVQSQRETTALWQALAEANFWTTPASKVGGAEDGAYGIIEARKGNAYRIVVRINGDDQRFQGAAKALSTAADLTIASP